MNGLRFLKGAAVVLATLGVAIPSPKLFADQGTKTPAVKSTVNKASKSQVPDVSLAGGVFAGRVVDHTGTPLEGAEVVIKQDGKELHRVMTDDKGLFTAENMKGGVYHVSSGNTEGHFRLWTEKTAPPVAKGHALLVMGENGARGQISAVSPELVAIVAALVALLIITAITLDKVNDVEDKVNKSN